MRSLAYLKADLRPGIDLVLEAVDMDEAMKGADLVFTGEGRLDHQTAMGKAPVGIAALAKKHGAAVIAFAGSVADGAEACNEKGIDAYFPILRQVVTLEEAMEPQRARQNMAKTAEAGHAAGKSRQELKRQKMSHHCGVSVTAAAMVFSSMTASAMFSASRD